MSSQDLGLLFSGLMGHLFFKIILTTLLIPICVLISLKPIKFDKGVFIVFVVYRRITIRFFFLQY